MNTVLLARPRPDILQISLNRPDRLNAFDADTIEALVAAFAQSQDPACRAVVLTGVGRAFSSGVDLVSNGMGRFLDDRDPIEGRTEWGEFVTDAFRRMRRISVPVVAAVNGVAAGGGLSLALLADVRIAGASAEFRNGYIRNGISGCELGTSYTLPRLVGHGRAVELMLSGRAVGAEEAERIGLVNRVVEDVDLPRAAVEFAAELSQHSPYATAMTKQVAHANLDAPSVEAAMALEIRTQLLALHTDDSREARDSLRERRAPAYTGYRTL